MSDAGDASVDGNPDAAPDVLPPLDVTIPPDREAGVRAPLPGPCDPVDPVRCSLPWPSNRYTVADPTRPTGLKLNVDVRMLNALDSPASFNRADGFSRVTPVLVGIPDTHVDAMTLGDGTTAAVRLFIATPGPRLGEPVPMRMQLVTNMRVLDNESLLMAFPRVPLEFNTDYVAVLMDTVKPTTGGNYEATPSTQVALGLRNPATADDVLVRSYHAPTRTLLRGANVDLTHVLRVWDFTTRSRTDATSDLVTMRAKAVEAVTMNRVQATINRMTVTTDTNDPVLAAFEGTISGLPTFVGTNGRITRDAMGLPVSSGTHDAPFRVMVPRMPNLTNGNYRVVMFGHGTGGNYNDDSFDHEIALNGAAKVGFRFTGLTDTDVITTLSALVYVAEGSEGATDVLVGSVADGMAIQAALPGVIGTAVSATTVMGMANPSAGRKPDTTVPIWAGGSLGGTMGLVYSNVEPTIQGSVLNVPGAAWSHFLVGSALFGIARPLLYTKYAYNDVSLQLALAMSQLNWDRADGASFIGLTPSRNITFLVQESIGDPILPNIGSDMVATGLNSFRIGAEISPIPLLRTAMEATSGQAGFTQYRVPRTVTGNYDIHGFAAKGSVAGDAAREQVLNFVRSVWAGAPRVTLPTLCVTNTPANSCDFVNR